MPSHSDHAWKLSEWTIADSTVTARYVCTRRSCPAMTYVEKLFRTPSKHTTKVVYSQRAPSGGCGDNDGSPGEDPADKPEFDRAEAELDAEAHQEARRYESKYIGGAEIECVCGYTTGQLTTVGRAESSFGNHIRAMAREILAKGDEPDGQPGTFIRIVRWCVECQETEGDLSGRADIATVSPGECENLDHIDD